MPSKPINATTPPAVHPELAGALALFLAPGEGRRGDPSAGVLSLRELAAAFADAAARLAAAPAALLALPVRTSINIQPFNLDRLPESVLQLWVDGVAAALCPGAPPQRTLLSAGSVHYVSDVVAAGGLAATVMCGVEPNDEERTDHRRRVAGHRLTLEPAGGVDGRPLVRALCGCGEYTSEIGSEKRARHGWGRHADAAVARIGQTDPSDGAARAAKRAAGRTTRSRRPAQVSEAAWDVITSPGGGKPAGGGQQGARRKKPLCPDCPDWAPRPGADETRAVSIHRGRRHGVEGR